MVPVSFTQILASCHTFQLILSNTHTHTHARTHARTHAHTHARARTRARTHTHALTHAHTNARAERARERTKKPGYVSLYFVDCLYRRERENAIVATSLHPTPDRKVIHCDDRFTSNESCAAIVWPHWTDGIPQSGEG